MRFLKVITVVLLLALIGAVGLFFYLQFNNRTYPLQRTITRADGKSLEVNILGRSGDVITFTPTTVQHRYTIGISELAWKDQWLKWVLPEIAPSVVEKTDQYIANRMAEIERLEKKLEKLKNDSRSLKVNWILRQKATRDIPKVVAEIKELELAIKEYKLRQKR
ncbi:MAG: hypothetical protein CMO55_23515 [Verrucomicrobiales bacterium]|nr:hypothetical protein [Verrucomicrobiales bacterium]